ncbi:MAG: hypothetical protein ACYCOO_12280 [Chitinophagaceae bacterium]
MKVYRNMESKQKIKELNDPIQKMAGRKDSLLFAEHNLVSKRIYFLTLQAMFNAVIIGFIAKCMVLFINLFTNIAFHGRFPLPTLFLHWPM